MEKTYLRGYSRYAISIVLLVILSTLIFTQVAIAQSTVQFAGYKIMKEEGQVRVRINVSGIQQTDPVTVRITIARMSYYDGFFYWQQEFKYDKQGPGEYTFDVPYPILRYNIYARHGTRYRMVIWVTVPGVDGTTTYAWRMAYDLYA